MFSVCFCFFIFLILLLIRCHSLPLPGRFGLHFGLILLPLLFDRCFGTLWGDRCLQTTFPVSTDRKTDKICRDHRSRLWSCNFITKESSAEHPALTQFEIEVKRWSVAMLSFTRHVSNVDILNTGQRQPDFPP